MPDTVCSDLSWPGFCLEDLSSGHIDAGGGGGGSRPLLVHASGPQNSHLALLRPRPPSAAAAAAASGDGAGRGRVGGTAPGAPCGLDPKAAAAAAAAAAVTADASAAIELENRIALHAGPIRQIATLASRAGAPPRLFARCDYSATLVGACKVVDRLEYPPEWGGRAVYERRIRRAKAAAGMPLAVDDAATVGASSSSLSAAAGARPRRRVGGGGVGGGGEEEEEGEGEDDDPDPFAGLDGFSEEERLVFSRRLTCAACSPFTPTHAAFLDEEFRLFQWHAGRGAAVAHGPGPLPLAAAPAALPVPRSEARARRARNADVALDYGAHPRLLWVAARHRAYRVDLRERPTPAALAPALEPGVYYASRHGEEAGGGGGGDRGKREAARVRSLAVGRRSAHEVFVAAGPHLSCMDARFPRDVVARWDLPQEADQLRWLPGVPGEGADAEGRSVGNPW